MCGDKLWVQYECGDVDPQTLRCSSNPKGPLETCKNWQKDPKLTITNKAGKCPACTQGGEWEEGSSMRLSVNAPGANREIKDNDLL